MAERDRRGVGERIVGWCLGALACAIALTMTVELIQSIWPWLLLAVSIGVALAVYRWSLHRW